MMKKENPDDITSLSSLAIVLRKRKKKETLRDGVLNKFKSATIWDRYGKKVMDDGKVVDEKWLKKKLARMQGRGKRKKF